MSSRECKVLFEPLTCDCSNEVSYLGGLGVFRVYDGNQTCCHTTCGSFYQTSGDPIKYKPNIWEIAPAIEYWYPFFSWAHVVGEPVAPEPFTYLETPKPKGTRIISVSVKSRWRGGLGIWKERHPIAILEEVLQHINVLTETWIKANVPVRKLDPFFKVNNGFARRGGQGQ